MVLFNTLFSISVLGLLTFTTSLPVSAPGSSISRKSLGLGQGDFSRSLSDIELLEREACQCNPDERPDDHDGDWIHHHHKLDHQHHHHHHHQEGSSSPANSGNSVPENSGFGSVHPGSKGSGVSSTPISDDSSDDEDSSDDDSTDGAPGSSSSSSPGSSQGFPGSSPESSSGSYPGSPSGSGSNGGTSSPLPGIGSHGSDSTSSGLALPPGLPTGNFPPGMSSWLASSGASTTKSTVNSTSSTTLVVTTTSTAIASNGQQTASSTSSLMQTVSSNSGKTYPFGSSSSLASSIVSLGPTSTSVSTTSSVMSATFSSTVSITLSTGMGTTQSTSSKTVSSSTLLKSTGETLSSTFTSLTTPTSSTNTGSTTTVSSIAVTGSTKTGLATLTSSTTLTSSATLTGSTETSLTTLTSSTTQSSSTKTGLTTLTSSTSLVSSTTLTTSSSSTGTSTLTSSAVTATSTKLTTSTTPRTSTTLTSATKTTLTTLATSTSSTLIITTTTTTTTSSNPGSTYTTTVKAVGAQPSGNAIIKPGLNELIWAGKDYTITWEPTTTGKITLLLLRGPEENIQVMYPLVEGYDNTGTFTWHVPTSLEPDTTHYSLQLIVESNGQYQYSTQFGVYNPSYTGKVTASMPTLTSTATTSTTSAAPLSTFSPRSNTNLFAWWGQNGQAPLGDFCKDTTYDVIIMSFLNTYKGAGGYPGMNLGTYTHTFPQTPAQKAAGATDLWDAKDVAADIVKCQAAGKKIFLSLGGAVAHASENFATEQEGTDFANMVWNLFLGGTSTLRPFGSVVLDGIDINNESWNTLGYGSLITGLRSQMDANKKTAPSGQYWLSGAAWPCDKITNSPNIPYSSFGSFDYITVQFYNSGTGVACNHISPPTSTSGFTAAVKQWSAAMSANTMLLVGALGVSQGQYGFLPPADLVTEVGQIRKLGLNNVGGYSLWDATVAQQIGMDGPVKAALIKG